MSTLAIVIISILGGLLVLLLIAFLVIVKAFGSALEGLAKGFGAPDLDTKKKKI